MGLAKRKYKNTELYLLLPDVFPSKVLDTMDQQYLYYKKSPIISPLLKHMCIELYNNKWIQPHSNTIKSKSRNINLSSNEIDALVCIPHVYSIIPIVAELNGGQDIPPPSSTPINPSSINYDSTPVHHSILQSRDRLFFISYTPACTMLCRWYLI